MSAYTATDNTWYGAWDFKKQVHTNGNSYWHMGGDIWNFSITVTLFIQ